MGVISVTGDREEEYRQSIRARAWEEEERETRISIQKALERLSQSVSASPVRPANRFVVERNLHKAVLIVHCKRRMDVMPSTHGFQAEANGCSRLVVVTFDVDVCQVEKRLRSLFEAL